MQNISLYNQIYILRHHANIAWKRILFLNDYQRYNTTKKTKGKEEIYLFLTLFSMANFYLAYMRNAHTAITPIHFNFMFFSKIIVCIGTICLARPICMLGIIPYDAKYIALPPNMRKPTSYKDIGQHKTYFLIYIVTIIGMIPLVLYKDIPHHESIMQWKLSVIWFATCYGMIPIISLCTYPVINIHDMFKLYMSKMSHHEIINIYRIIQRPKKNT